MSRSGYPRPRSRDGFEIAILCALPLESQAVENLFEEHYETDGFSYGKAVGDVNSYTIGRIGRHHVVLAGLPGMGKVNAATTAIHLQKSFRHIRHAGLEDRLFPSDYRHQHHASSSQPPSCQFCCNGMLCEAAMKDSCIELGCDLNQVIQRVKSVSRPTIYFGRVASADTVMKSGWHRDEITQREKIIAFEMEAAGIWEHLPTVMIKSACDYADSHKSKEWQEYTAVVAAACLRAFLIEWRCEDREDRAMGADSLGRVSLRPSQMPWYTSKQEEIDCLRSLSFPNMDARKEDIVLAHPGTCDWLFLTPTYQAWYNNQDHHEVLWIKGKPGAGKSTLMKHSLLYCENNLANHIIIPYFFHARGGSPLERSLSGLFRTLTYRLVENVPHLLEAFLQLYRDNQRKYHSWEWRVRQLEDFLLRHFERSIEQPIILLVDALDECDEPDVRKAVRFLERVNIAARKVGNPLRICLSSRHYSGIAMQRCFELNIDDEYSHHQDIRIYVHANLNCENSSLRSSILSRTSGVFIWVILVVDLLNQDYDNGVVSVKRLQERLEEIPTDIDKLFTAILQQNNDRADLTITIIFWILFRYEHLGLTVSLDELAGYYAVMVYANKDELQVIEAHDNSVITFRAIRKFLTSVSRGLVEVRENGHVQFIHQTFNDFLVRGNRLGALDPSLQSNTVGRGHDRLADICLSYLEQLPPDLFTTSFADSETYVRDRHHWDEQYPLLRYAARYVFKHVAAAHENGVWQTSRLQSIRCDENLLQRLINLPKLLRRPSILLLDGVLVNNEHDHVQVGDRLVYLLATYREYTLLRLMHDQLGVTAEDLNGSTDTPLLGSLLQGQKPHGARGYNMLANRALPPVEPCARILLKMGADPNSTVAHGVMPLQIAVMYGTILQHAVIARCGLEFINVLLSAGARVNDQAGLYDTALQAAVTKSSRFTCETVLCLLRAGADPNLLGGIHCSPIHAACVGLRDSPMTLAVLLDSGADPNLQHDICGSPLKHLMKSRLESRYSNLDLVLLVHTLLDAGATIDTTLLTEYEVANSIQMILQSGQQDEIERRTGTFPWAECMRVLIEHGADINFYGQLYWTPLEAAIVVYSLKSAGYGINNGHVALFRQRLGAIRETRLNQISAKNGLET